MKRILSVVFVSVLSVVSAGAAERPQILSKREVKLLLEKANTPAEHTKLAQHFRLKSEKLEAEAVEHAGMAKLYRSRPTASDVKRPMAPDTAAHCEYLSENLHKAANEAKALSIAHDAMAHK